jgi:hypothetical protein
MRSSCFPDLNKTTASVRLKSPMKSNVSFRNRSVTNNAKTTEKSGSRALSKRKMLVGKQVKYAERSYLNESRGYLGLTTLCNSEPSLKRVFSNKSIRSRMEKSKPAMVIKIPTPDIPGDEVVAVSKPRVQNRRQ